MRKNASILLALTALVIFVFGLSACSKGRSTAIANTPSATVTATPTQSPTPLPSATIVPTRRPTRTPTPILPDLPDLSLPAEQYELVEPSLPVLGAVLHHAESLHDKSWEIYYDQRALSDLISTDAEYQFDAVVFSLQQQQKRHPLNIASLISDIYWGGWLARYGEIPPNAVDVILNAVTYDIQKQAIHLWDQTTITQTSFSLTPYKIELDHDAGAEWLVQVKIPDTSLLCFLLFNEGEDGSYSRLESQLPNFPYDGLKEYNILLLNDFTGDGLTDVLISENYYMMGSYITIYYVAQGNNDGMISIGSYSAIGYAYTYEGPIPSQVVDETTLAGLKITYSESISWDCYWDHDVTYHWIGGVEQKYETGKLPPDTPECRLAKAVSLTDPIDDQTAIQLLQSAIYGLSPKQNVKITFAHYRLALLYLKYEQPEQARKHLESMQKLYMNDPVTSEYLESALTPLLAAPDLSLLPVCQLGYSSPYEAFPGWRDYTHSTRVYHSYPGGEPVPEAVCPLVGFVEAQMDKIDFNGAGSPAEAVQKVGLPIQLIQSYSLSDWDRPAWFVVLDTQPYIIIANVPYAENHEFIWKRMSIFDGGDSEPFWLNQDITGDGIVELAITVKNPRSYCEDGKNGYQLLLTGAIRNNMITSIEGFECFSAIDPLNLEKEMMDNDGDGLSDLLVKFGEGTFPDSGLLDSEIKRDGPVTWFTQEEIWEMTHPADQPEQGEDGEKDPEKAIFSGQDPVEVRQKLEKLLKELSPDSLNYPSIYDRYRYLIALSYEMEGNTEEAIRSYLALAQIKPGTIWSNFAAAHLKQKSTP